jgi:hypothetical protein
MKPVDDADYDAISEENERLKAQLANFLKTAGATINESGELVFSSAGYGAWTKREGDERTREIAAENERLRHALDVMLNEAQLLRIQQVQATTTWEQHYKDKGNVAWKALNDAHRQAIEGIAKPAATYAPGCACQNCKAAREREGVKA